LLELLGLNVEGVLQFACFLIINFMNVRRARLQDFAAVKLISSLLWNLAPSFELTPRQILEEGRT